MEDNADTAPGEVVYLLAELRSGHEGPVHEIGSRARVLESDGERLTLAVGHGRDEDVVTCPRSLVARSRRTTTARRAFVRRDTSPAG